MSGPAPLFEINPALDRSALAGQFARDRRLQIRDILTAETAAEVRGVLTRHVPWGIAWQAGGDGPHMVRAEALTDMKPQESGEISGKLARAMHSGDYAFLYSCYPILTAYQEKWDEGSPCDLILEHLNAEPLLDFVRAVTGIAELRKADAQATLYRPGHFLAAHDDSEAARGRRVAYVLNMTAQEEWRPEWGGCLEFLDEGGEVTAGFRPRFNALNLFAVPQRHWVSHVAPFAPLGRYAITGWFRDQ